MAENTIYYTTNTWNLARSLASKAVDVADEEITAPTGSVTIGELYGPLMVAYGLQAQENDVWPFEDLLDLLELVDEHVGLASDTRPIDELAKVVCSRIQDDSQYEYVHQPATDESEDDAESESESESESKSESESTDESESGTDVDADSESESDVEDDSKDESEDETKVEPESDSESVDGGVDEQQEVEQKVEKKRRKSVGKTNANVEVKPGDVLTPDGIRSADDENTVSNGVGNSESGDADSEPDNEQPDRVAEHPESETVREVAEKLYQCFITHDSDQTYRELQAEYESVFPQRAVTLTQVANSKGGTKPDRVDSIAQWVAIWFGSEQQVAEENRYARRPMGKPV